MQSRRKLFSAFYLMAFALLQIGVMQFSFSNVALLGASIATPPQNETAAEQPLESSRKGAFQITRKSMPATIYGRASKSFGKNSPRQAESNIRGESDIVYEVRVGDNYDPQKPAGVFVYINAGNDGRPPRGYESVLADRNIIFIGANNSGNKIDAAWRVGMAAYAVQVLDEAYRLDYDRIYVGGLSGGGRAASHGMMEFQDVFSGGLPMVGANPMIPMKNANSKGKVYHSSGVKGFKKSNLKVAAKTGRYVFYSAEEDFNQANVKAVYEGYRKNGFKFVTYLEEPNHGHSTASPEFLGKAIEFLDAPIEEIAIARMKTAAKLTHSQPTLATRYYELALLHISEQNHPEDRETAEKALAKLKSSYSTELEKTQAKIKRTGAKSKLKVLEKFASKWGQIGASDVAQMQKELEQTNE